MRKQKKICFRLTSNRILGAALVIISAVNLSIVGVVFGLSISDATPTMTVEWNPATTGAPATATTVSHVPTISTAVATETVTGIETPSIAPTNTFTPTVTATWTASVVSCVPRYSWMIYYVQRGDTLYSLGRLTNSTVDELKLANCLSDTLIITGQLLYVPRLPVRTPTPTWTYTPKPDLPPVVTIISAKVNSSYTYDGYDEKLGLAYTYITLDGSAIDPEDGILTSFSLIWSTDRSDIYQYTLLGMGNSVRAILYSNNCAGAWHTITLTATDSKGQVAFASVKIFIGSTDCQVGINHQDTWRM